MRKVITVIITVIGILFSSHTYIETTIAPVKVDYRNDTDVKLIVTNEYITKEDYLIPIHRDEQGSWYTSETLSMNDLKKDTFCKNFIYETFDVKLSKNVENTNLFVSISCDSEDVLNGSIRGIVQVKGIIYEINGLGDENGVTITNETLNNTTTMNVRAFMWYELDSPTTTIENINAAEGGTIKLNLYVKGQE